MKKIIAVALLACMTLFCAACSESSSNEESSGKVSIESSDVSKESSVQESSKQESSKQESSKQESSKQESSKVEESSEQESSEAEESSEQESSKAEESSEQESSEAEESSEQVQPTEQPVVGQFSADDMSFTYNNYKISLHDKMQNVIASIGNANSVETAPSCLAINLADDKMYYYNGFMIQTYTDSEAEKVYMIQITGASAATTKGITIGSTAADIEKAYGISAATEHSDFLYSNNTDSKTHLDFFMESGKVTDIFYTYDVT